MQKNSQNTFHPNLDKSKYLIDMNNVTEDDSASQKPQISISSAS